VKFVLIEEATKADAKKNMQEVKKKEEVVSAVRRIGPAFIVACKQSFADSAIAVTVGTVTNSTAHYVTCEELGLDHRNVSVSFLKHQAGEQLYKIVLN
jgi:hypothetical protein